MNVVRIVLLGFLYEKPLHGYEIKHMIEDHMDDWTDIKVGSIYFALNKLTEEGYIKIKEEFKEGNRPIKTVYEITNEGRTIFLRLLTQLWSKDLKTVYPIDIGIFFIHHLPKVQVRAIIEGKISAMEQTLKYLENHKLDHTNNPHIPPQAIAIMDHSLLHMKAEYTWLKELLKNIDSFY